MDRSIRFCFNRLSNRIHITRFTISEFFIYVFQRTWGFKHGFCLPRLQRHFLHAHQNVFSRRVFIGMIQNLRRLLRQELFTIAVLLVFSFFRKAWLHSQYCSFQFSPLCYLFDFRTAQHSASQGYGRVTPAVWLLMPVRHKPLSRLTGCGRLIRIIAPPVPLFSATRTVGSPLYSIRGREEVSLCPCRLIALCLPHRDDEMRLSLGLNHLRAASSVAPLHGICTRKLV